MTGDDGHSPDCTEARRGGKNRWPFPSEATRPIFLACPHTTHDALRTMWGAQRRG